jgi:hypothetical protein
MSNARLRLAFAGGKMSETMSPLGAPVYIESVEEPPGSLVRQRFETGR